MAVVSGSTNRLFGLAAALLVAGCVTPGPTALPPGAVRICDGAGCRVQPRDAVTAQLDDGREMERQADPNPYRGEPVAELRAAAEAGDSGAAYRLGQAHEVGAGGAQRSAALAARHYEQAAGAGEVWAQWRLAEMVSRGAAGGGAARALELYTAAAQGGVARAAYNAGVAHQQGRGTPRNQAEALRYFEIAARNGVPEAQYNLALMYFRGEGVGRDAFQGVTWMRRAAHNGVLAAQRAAGRAYLTGIEEMGQDLTEARSLLSMAAARGDGESQRLVAQIDRAVAQERAAQAAFERQMALQREQTMALWGAVILNALLTPPPVTVVYRW